jgi:eukaryotic-like serine/threonine-protein kinase
MDAKASPDAKWLAYMQRDTNASRPEVLVQSLSTTGAKWRISTAGGRWPRWRADGKELFYLAAGGNLMDVPIEADTASLRAGVPKVLFQAGLSVLGEGLGFFGVSADGQRFLLKVADDQHRTASIVVVTNWPAAVNAKRQRQTVE